MASSESQQHDAELVDAPPQLPEGVYLVVYDHHETGYLFKSSKVFVHYRVYGGPYDGVMVYAAYPVKAIKGKPRRNGGFKLGHSQKLFREMVALRGRHDRPDRVSLRGLKHAVIRVRIRTVTHDARQRPLAPANQYSVVDAMLGIEAGSVQ